MSNELAITLITTMGAVIIAFIGIFPKIRNQWKEQYNELQEKHAKVNKGFDEFRRKTREEGKLKDDEMRAITAMLDKAQLVVRINVTEIENIQRQLKNFGAKLDDPVKAELVKTYLDQFDKKPKATWQDVENEEIYIADLTARLYDITGVRGY